MINIQRLTPHWKPIQLAPTHSGSDALFNQVSLKFRDTANDGQKQPSYRAIRRDVFPPRDELDSKAVKLINHRQKVLGRTRNPVERGHDDHAELPLPSILQHQVEAGATSTFPPN
jgi:hypothetical protein